MVRERLALEYPEAELRAGPRRTRSSSSSRRSSRRRRTDENVNKVTPALFARVPDARRPRRRRTPTTSSGSCSRPASTGRRPRTCSAWRACSRSDFDGEVPDRARRPREAARGRPQDRQRGALGRVRPPGPAGRHPRRPAVAPAQAHHRGRPGEGRARPQRARPARGARPVLAAADPPRSPGLLRAQARLRAVRAGRHLPVGRSRGEGAEAKPPPAATTD